MLNPVRSCRWQLDRINRSGFYVNRALRKAYGIGSCSVEELGWLRYTADGELEIDNNNAERSLRPIVVGRNNWLFYGSDEGGRTGAVLSSLIASCKRLHVEPLGYLRDLFTRISTHPNSRLDELLPDKWLVAQRKISGAHEET